MKILEPVAILLCILIVVSVTLSLFHSTPSPDVLPLLTAGQFWSMGQPDQIYAAETDGYFRMLPPSGWPEYLRADGYSGPIYPYIYPPLWVALGAALNSLWTYEQIGFAGHVLNPILFAVTLVLALRVTTPPGRFVATLLLSTCLCLTLIPVVGALAGNQPQILVAFLTVLAINRRTRGRPTAAGIALALAASIKIFPALLALIWLAVGDRKSFSRFATSFGVLAMTSVLIMGWPLHSAFLNILSEISAGLIVSSTTASIEAFVFHEFFQNQLVPVLSYAGSAIEPSNISWHVYAKPTLLIWGEKAVLLLALVLLVLLARRKAKPDLLIWPLTLLMFSLLSPLSWKFHYIAPLVFFPALAQRFSFSWAVLIGLGVLAPLSILVQLTPTTTSLTRFAVPALVLYAGALIFAIIRGHEPSRNATT